MKKVLALLLVLFVVELSNAASLQYALYDTSGNPMEMNLEGYGRLFINTEYRLEVVLGVEDGEDVSSFNTSLVADGPLASWDVIQFNDRFKNGLWRDGMILDGSNANAIIWDTRGSTPLMGPYGQDGDILATYSLVTAGEEGWLTLDDYVGPGLVGAPIPYTSKVSAETVEISGLKYYVAVPEPMTMSLLGLGGIALIRRKRVK